jgi:hypothetical protein
MSMKDMQRGDAMPITVEWENEEKTIVHVRYKGRWTWAEFMEHAGREAAEMMKTVPHRVDVLADYFESGPLPLGGAMTQARGAIKQWPENWGILVVVSDNSIINSLVNVFHTTFAFGLGGRTYAATSYEDAFKLMAEQREKVASRDKAK